jgi:hypothetical protein
MRTWIIKYFLLPCFHNLYSSRNVIRVMKSRRIRWVGNTTWMREMTITCKILIGKPKKKKSLGYQDWKIILKLILKRVWGYGLDSSGSGQGPMVSSCEHNNKPWSSGKFLARWATMRFSRSVLCSRVPFHRICDKFSTRFFGEVP